MKNKFEKFGLLYLWNKIKNVEDETKKRNASNKKTNYNTSPQVKNKYIFGGIIIVVFIGLMAYLFTQSNIQYESDFAKVKTTEKTVKATGSWVKEKNYELNRAENTFSFFIVDESGNEMKVVYEGTIPNNFETAKSVVVTGTYKEGYFHAKDILTKCPSKYEEENVKSSSL